MKTFYWMFAVLLLAGCASNPETQQSAERPLDLTGIAEPVDRAWMPTLNSWAEVDRSHLILYSSHRQPYLITLKRPVTSPMFGNVVIGVRQTGSYLTRFDYVMIDGWRHYIESIRPLTVEQAEALS